MSAARYVNFNQSLPIGESSSLFSRIKTAGSNLNNTTIMIIIAVILFVIIALLYYFYYVAPQMKAKYKPNSEQVPIGSESGNEAELLFFFADWCPHCKTAKPAWNDLQAEYENKTINGYKVIFTEVNCTDESPDVEKMMDKYKIEGFPTIKLIKDGQVIEYDAKPTKATLVQFLNTVL